MINHAHDHIHYTASGGHCETKTRSLLHFPSHQPTSFPKSITMVTKSDSQKNHTVHTTGPPHLQAMKDGYDYDGHL
jgi:hypothetical protein